MFSKVNTTLISDSRFERYQKHSQTYSKGISDELKILEWLDHCGSFDLVEKSTKEDDIYNDIDAYAWKSNRRFTLSIKSDNRALTTGNLCFELQVLDRVSLLWEESWYYKDKDLYVFLVGSSVYYLRPSSLKMFINDNGWSKVVTLNLSTQQNQRNMNHRHINAKLGIVSMKSLLDTKVMIYKGEV